MLFAPREATFAAGVVDPWTPPDGPPDRVVLGVATIEGPGGLELRRLPSLLAAWALDVVAVTQSGLTILPRCFRLRVAGDQADVTIVEPPDPPKSDADAVDTHRALTLFVDESGNSGDVARDPLGFGGQRIFVLVGLGDDAGPGSLEAIFQELLAKHGVKAHEMKGRSMKRRPTFVRDLVADLGRSNSVFVEIMDKKFYFATNIVSFALHSGAFDPYHQPSLANTFADLVTEVIDDDAVLAYAQFGHRRDDQGLASFERTFTRALLRSKLRMGAHREREFRLLDQVELNFRRALTERRGDVRSFLAPPDRDHRGAVVSMLPHVAALAGLLARANHHAAGRPGIRIVHDRQAQFELALRDCVKQVEAHAEAMVVSTAGTASAAHEDWDLSGRVQLEFADSKRTPAIQAADVLARFCMQRMVAVVSRAPTDPRQDEAAALLHDLQRPSSGPGVRIVATTDEAARFWQRGGGR